MRAHLLAVSVLLAACSSAASDPAPTSTSDPTTTTPAPSGGAASTPAPGSATPADAAAAAPDCSLAALAKPADVTPEFVIGAPPAMTGGALAGSYVVTKAKVFLPSTAAGLVDTTQSKGRIAAWSVFAGTRYRLYLSADFTIATSFGPQSQATSSESQGGFTTTGAALKLDHACDTTLANEADYSFTDDGTGHATIMVQTPTPYGDVYLQLEAGTH